MEKLGCNSGSSVVAVAWVEHEQVTLSVDGASFEVNRRRGVRADVEEVEANADKAAEPHAT